MIDPKHASAVLAFQEGLAAAVHDEPRSANPYAKGWSRNAVLVIPDSLAERWDRGWVLGRISRNHGG